MKKLITILLCLGLVGCATPKNKYAGVYNDAVNSGHSVVILKEGDFETMEEGVNEQLSSVGYDKVLYNSPTELFAVLVKSIDYGSPLLNGDAQSHKIFLKYTKIDEGHTRIDLVNGGTEPSVKDEIDRDIQKLAALIRSS
jgi:hypothetical protein